MSTGEFVHSIYDVTTALGQRPDEKAKKLESGLKAYLAKVKNSPAYQRGNIMLGTVGAASSGATVAQKLEQLSDCATDHKR